MFENKVKGIKMLKKMQKRENLDFGVVSVHYVQLLHITTNTFVQSITLIWGHLILANIWADYGFTSFYFNLINYQ